MGYWEVLESATRNGAGWCHVWEVLESALVLESAIHNGAG